MHIVPKKAPSRFIAAQDFKANQQLKLMIARVTEEDLSKENEPEDLKYCLYFHGKEKGVVLNVGNTEACIVAFGADSDQWINQSITFVILANAGNGKQGFMATFPTPTAAPAQPPAPVVQQRRQDGVVTAPVGGVPAPDPEDDIPF